MYGQLEEGAFVYVHSTICETSVMEWYSIHLWSIGGGYIFPMYMCILLCVKHIWCSGIPYIYGQLEEGALVYVHSAICEISVVEWYSIHLWSIGGDTSVLCICALCYMLNIFGVVVFHTSMVNWRGYICPKYICILLYIKHIWCSGIP